MSRNYDFLGIDEGKQSLFRAETSSGKISWLKSLSDYPIARSMQRLDETSILLGYERGYCTVDIRNGNILKDISKWKDVTSVYRCKNGKTLITGLDLNGKKGVCVCTLDEDDEIIDTAVQEGDYVRLMSVKNSNTYLLSTNESISICDNKLNVIQKLSAEGFLHAWQTKVMPDNSILVSGGYGAFMARFSEEGKLLSTFGRANEVPKEVNPFFYAAFEIDIDGNLLVANWQGHGTENGLKGRQLLLFNPEGKFLDSWSFSNEVSSLQGLLIL